LRKHLDLVAHNVNATVIGSVQLEHTVVHALTQQ
jgi:hypothetical protein